MGYGHVDSIAKLVPAPPGKQVTLQRVPAGHDPAKDSTIYARREAPELEQREAAEEEVAELLSLAMRTWRAAPDSDASSKVNARASKAKATTTSIRVKPRWPRTSWSFIATHCREWRGPG